MLGTTKEKTKSHKLGKKSVHSGRKSNFVYFSSTTQNTKRSIHKFKKSLKESQITGKDVLG